MTDHTRKHDNIKEKPSENIEEKAFEEIKE